MPSLQPCAAELGPFRAAQRIMESGPLTEVERHALVQEDYRRTLNRHAYASVELFEEAVAQQLREMRRADKRLDAEAPFDAEIDQDRLPLLPRVARDLEPIRRQTVRTAKEILPPQQARRLTALPDVRWTKRCVKSTWGHWSLRMSGRGKGKASIRINRVLRTRPKHVPNEMLAYLVYHEVLHHLLPGQGHDAEFRELEALWPEADRWDLAFDTLHETWNLSAERYSSDHD